MSEYPEQDKELKEADRCSKFLATHLYNMGASRIEESINILETPHNFKLLLRQFDKDEIDCEIKANKDGLWLATPKIDGKKYCINLSNYESRGFVNEVWQKLYNKGVESDA